MRNQPDTQSQFLETMGAIVNGSDSHDALTDRLRAALLSFGSETPDNLNCTNRIEVGTVGSNIGIKVQGQEVLMSNMAHILEDAPMPKELQTVYPALTQQDWDAFTRLATLFFCMLEPTRR